MTDTHSSQIRIAHVALQLETGGMERLLADFARYADRERFQLRFVALGTKGPIAKDIESCGWSVTALEAGPGVSPSIALRLAQIFREERVDIVHTHNTKPLLYGGPAARVAWVGGVVHTRHGQRFGATRRQDLMFRLAGRCADRVVCVSEDAARLCRRDGVDAGPLRTIWNGIDQERFSYAGPAVGGPAVYVGRLSPEKDVATLLRAAAVAVGECPSFRLQVAGDGPSAVELKALAKSLGIGARVEFLGEVRDVPALLRWASVFVLSSVTEGLPLTVLEAMACGLPVVATRVGGTPEAVLDGVCGLLVEPGKPERLAEALLRVYRDPKLGAEMGRCGQRRVREHFDVRAMVSRYESLYEEVLQGAAAIAA